MGRIFSSTTALSVFSLSSVATPRLIALEIFPSNYGRHLTSGRQTNLAKVHSIHRADHPKPSDLRVVQSLIASWISAAVINFSFNQPRVCCIEWRQAAQVDLLHFPTAARSVAEKLHVSAQKHVAWVHPNS